MSKEVAVKAGIVAAKVLWTAAEPHVKALGSELAGKAWNRALDYIGNRLNCAAKANS